MSNCCKKSTPAFLIYSMDKEAGRFSYSQSLKKPDCSSRIFDVHQTDQAGFNQ